MAAWIWFVIAGLAAVAGAALFASDYGRRTARSRERRRWAGLRGWRFVESDPVLPDRWHFGVIAQGGAGEAHNLVIGRVFTSESRRPVYVFDHQQNGRITSAVAAVQRREGSAAVVLELWQRDTALPRDAGLELMGPVGTRYGFVTDISAARRLITPGLVAACEEVGDDVPVAWLEQEWVLAAAPSAATPARLERLLRTLGEIADQVDGPEGDEDGTHRADGAAPDPEPGSEAITREDGDATDATAREDSDSTDRGA